MTHKTQPTAHAEITAPISADLRRIEQEARELPEPSPTAGMNLGQRILHVGGRENAAGYIEFGSVAAVRALVSQVLRDRHAAQPARECLHLSAEAQAWLVHLPSSDTQNVYDSRDDAGYIDDLTNNDDAVVTPLYAALQVAPPAPAAVAVPAPIAAGMKAAADLVQEQADLYIAEHAETDPDTGAVIWHHRDYGFDWHNGLEELAQKLLARAAVAAAPAQAAAWMTPEGDRVVTEATMASARKDGGAMLSSLRPFTVALARAAAECDSPELCQVHRGCAGQYGTKNTCPSFAVLNPCNSAATAQAVAVPAEVELPDVEDMAHSAVQEALSFGVNHDVFHRWMRAVMDKTVQALAAAPAQEHATQLAGQGQTFAQWWDEQRKTAAERAPGDDWMDLNADDRDQYEAAFSAGKKSAAPAQAQEDARDAARYRYWKHWWIHEDSETAQLPKTVEQMLEDLDIDAAFDAAIDAARAAQGGAA